MNRAKRPLSVTIVAWVYIAVGTLGFAYHSAELRSVSASQYDIVWVELVELIAVTCGAFMLRRHDWARWLALAWIVFHVILSAFHNWREFAMHALICIVITWVLLRPAAARYFRAARAAPV